MKLIKANLPAQKTSAGTHLASSGGHDGVTGSPAFVHTSSGIQSDGVTGCNPIPTKSVDGVPGYILVPGTPICTEFPNSPSPCHRYCLPPDEEIPLAAYHHQFSVHQGALLVEHVLRQSGGRPGPVLDWVMQQANRYFEAFPKWSFQDQDHAAALDLLVWQRADRIKSTSRWLIAQEVIEFLEGLEETINHVKEIKRCQS